MKDYVAFFDVDHTIVNGNSGKILALQAYKYGMFSMANLLTGSLLSWMYKIGLVSSEKMIKIMTGWLTGISEAKLNELISKIFKDVIINHIRDKACKEVEWHNKNKGRTVILSSAISHICDPIKEYLEMDDMICTNIELINGRFTGLSKGKYCYKEEKLYQAKKYCEKHGFTLADAYFYSDSTEDLPLLEKVGNPVCVTPEPALAKIAGQKKWTVDIW
jgi:HAD superfamily hydrolase (TIGR01490 family)